MTYKKILLVFVVFFIVDCSAIRSSHRNRHKTRFQVKKQAQLDSEFGSEPPTENWNDERPPDYSNYPSSGDTPPSESIDFTLCFLYYQGMYECSPPDDLYYYEFNAQLCKCEPKPIEKYQCYLYAKGSLSCPPLTDDAYYTFNYDTCRCEAEYGWICNWFGLCGTKEEMERTEVPPKDATLCDLFYLGKYECPWWTQEYYYRFNTTTCECDKYDGDICSVPDACSVISNNPIIAPYRCQQYELKKLSCMSYQNVKVFLNFNPNTCVCDVHYGDPCSKLGVCETVEEVLNKIKNRTLQISESGATENIAPSAESSSSLILPLENGTENLSRDSRAPSEENPSSVIPTREAPSTEKLSSESPLRVNPSSESPSTEESSRETTELPPIENPTTESPSTEESSRETNELPPIENHTTETPSTEDSHNRSSSEEDSKESSGHKHKHYYRDYEGEEIVCYKDEDQNEDGEDDCYYIIEEDGIVNYYPI